MDGYLLDWVNLLLRWTHVIVGIAWIGASFYFVFLDFSLKPPTDPALKAKGVDGELWAVHGGGFYNPQKYLVAPKSLPDHLHWFYWESYWTWMSGFALFVVLYLFNASSFLVDKNVYDWSAGAAVAGALGFLVLFWFVYDFICRSLMKSAERRPDRRRAGVPVRRRRVMGGLPPVRRARRVPDGRRDDGHGDERQRVLLDHPRPAQGDRADEGRPAGGPDLRPACQAAQRAQHLLHAAGADLDAVQPLRLAVPGQEQLAGAGADHAGRRADTPFLRGAAQGAGGRQARALGVRHRRHADHRRPGGRAGAGAACRVRPPHRPR